MSQPHSPSDRASAERRLDATPAEQPAPPRRFRYWPAALVLLCGGLLFAGYAAYHAGTTEKEPKSAELDLCRRFMALKNAREPAANDLLGPAPVVPAEAVTPEEADRLHAEFFLRDNYQIVGVRPETADVSGPDARFVLVLEGGVSSPRIAQTGPKGVDVINRVMTNPDVVVRVENNRLRAVLGRTHHDPHEKQISDEEQRRRVRRLFEP